jgi:hypothetical protein
MLDLHDPSVLSVLRQMEAMMIDCWQVISFKHTCILEYARLLGTRSPGFFLPILLLSFLLPIEILLLLPFFFFVLLLLFIRRR